MAAVAAAWLIVAPPTADLAAHSYRAWLFDTEGFALFNNQWYGGHHVPGYSLLFPPLAGWLGVRVAVAVAGLAAGAALVALTRDAAPERTAAAWLAASAAATNLIIGRGPFSLGLAFGALALLLARHERRGTAAAAALACAWSSPVAGLFLGLAGVAWRRWEVAIPAVAGAFALALAFPEGGSERFVATAFWPMLAVSAAAVLLLKERTTRIAGALYVIALVAAFVIDTPMGQNALRLGVLAGPVLLAVAGRGPKLALIAVGAALLYLQWLPAVRAVVETRGDPATEAAYHRPLLDLLDARADPGDRVEIPMTRNHWEAAHVAPHWALARGWERQLDLKVNALFYDDEPLTPARYEAWLRREAIRWVALPDAPLDFSADAEAALLRRDPPFLEPVASPPHWRVWEVRDPTPAASGPARIEATGPQRVELAFARAGETVVRRRFTRFWRIAEGAGCVDRAPGGWTLVRVDAPQRVVIETSMKDLGPRCRRG